MLINYPLKKLEAAEAYANETLPEPPSLFPSLTLPPE